MVTVFGILGPGERPEGPSGKKRFFSDVSDDDRPSRAERDAALLAGKYPPFPEPDPDREARDHTLRQFWLISPP